jgi:hypothetical protein
MTTHKTHLQDPASTPEYPSSVCGYSQKHLRHPLATSPSKVTCGRCIRPKKQKREKTYTEFLKENSRVIASWPAWKRELFVRTQVTLSPATEATTAPTVPQEPEESCGRNDHPAEHAERLLNFLGSGTVRGISATERVTIQGYIGDAGRVVPFEKPVRVVIVFLEEEA